MGAIEDLHEAVVDGRAKVAAAKTHEALEAGADPDSLLNDVLMGVMAEVGALFQAREIFVPEMLVSARAMDASLAVLKPYLVQDATAQKAKIVVGTVKGDLHDIGKNLVIMMLRGAGYDVTDLGVDVLPERFVEVVRELQPRVLALSALLTTTMVNIKPVINAITDAGLREQIFIIVGGAPVTQAYADEIGADGYRAQAARVVELVDGLLAQAS